MLTKGDDEKVRLVLHDDDDYDVLPLSLLDCATRHISSCTAIHATDGYVYASMVPIVHMLCIFGTPPGYIPHPQSLLGERAPKTCPCIYMNITEQ